MIQKFAVSVLMAGLAAGGWAAEGPAPLYARLIANYPAPALAPVHSRELKFLIDPARLPDNPEAALSRLWSRVQAAGTANGFTFAEKWDTPLRTTLSYQEYFDTPDQKLWAKGYLIRTIKQLSAVGKKHKPPSALLEVTFKAILPDYAATLAAPLLVTGAATVKAKAEDNVGMGPGRGLSSYLEKTATLQLAPERLGGLTLGDFAKFLPGLDQLGLPAGTGLQGTRAYTLEMEPGTVQLAGAEPCKVHLAAWSAKPDGKPYLYEFSIKYEFEDFYQDARTHASGEAFLARAIQDGLADLAMPDGAKWCGSAVRKLMNRPMPQSSIQGEPHD
jgi:hypothetical protein